VIVIGDIGGCFNSLMKLVAKFPPNEKILFVGDLNDRGPDSRKVISWVKDNGHECMHSNHGQMFCDFMLDTGIYEYGIWKQNGGGETLDNYLVKGVTNCSHREQVWDEDDGDYCLRKIYYDPIIMEHVNWLNTRPLFHSSDGAYVTHAPLNPNARNPYDITNLKTMDDNILWNRTAPAPREDGLISVFGHNGFFKRYYTEDKKLHAVCIDASREGYLCGYDTLKDIAYFQEIIE